MAHKTSWLIEKRLILLVYEGLVDGLEMQGGEFEHAPAEQGGGKVFFAIFGKAGNGGMASDVGAGAFVFPGLAVALVFDGDF